MLWVGETSCSRLTGSLDEVVQRDPGPRAVTPPPPPPGLPHSDIIKGWRGCGGGRVGELLYLCQGWRKRAALTSVSPGLEGRDRKLEP